jgi:hypothetical protein
MLLKSFITSLESIFCIFGSIILLVGMCIYDATCQIGKKNVVLLVLLATCVQNAMKMNGTCVVCLVVGYAIERCLINDNERKIVKKDLQTC